MAFQMIHMEIAYRLLSRISQIENAAEFILGSVAPDSVHMNPHYDVSMKVKSHMFEGCGTWGDTQDYQRWVTNINRFFCKIACERENGRYRDFAYGLCVHCLTDYWNDIKIWRKCQSKMIPPFSTEKFKEIYDPEARGIDLWLYQNSRNTKAIRNLLSEAVVVDVEGMVNKEDMNKQREYLLHTQYDTDAVDISGYHLLTADMLEDFIEFAVNDIAKKMTEWV